MELFETIRKDAALYRRTEANQVLWILEEYYRLRQREAELFSPRQLREAAPDHVPVFRGPDPPELGPVSGLHDSMRRDENE
jgi:hypothetical protein